jgi:hypothetical protein
MPTRARFPSHGDVPIAEQRSGVEGALADEGLRIDRQPRLAFSAQDVPAMEILMDDDELALGRDQLLNRAHCALDSPPFERCTHHWAHTKKGGLGGTIPQWDPLWCVQQ